MPIHFRCLSCARPLTIGSRQAGTAITCPLCEAPLMVPAENAISVAPHWWVAAVASRPTPPPLPAAPPVRNPRRPMRVGVGLAALLLVVGGLALAWYGSYPPAMPPVDPPPVAIGPTEPAPTEEILPFPAPETVVSVEPPQTVPLPPAVARGPRPVEPPSLAPTPVVRPEAVAEAPAKPARPAALVVKQRRELNEDELRRQVEKAVEVSLDRSADRTESREMLAKARIAHDDGKRIDVGPQAMKQRADLAGLPMLMGDDCHLGLSGAEQLEGGSLALRSQLGEAANVAARGAVAFGADPRPDPVTLHKTLNAEGGRHDKWLRPEAVPALQQLLMAENEAIRDVLVDQLSRIEGKKASVALAQRALFDLHPDVRKAALVALDRRPAEEYRQTLLDGFRYPWAAVADHAAEALAALGLKDAVPSLLSFLDLPDPTEPYRKAGKEDLYVREVVRVNHLHNCLMCHAPSLKAEDRVRGFVPPTDQPLPPAFTRQYYAATSGIFVRADVTYLRQDFSVPLAVKNHGVWPAVQRYDFLVRERPATLPELQARAALKDTVAARTPSEHQKALFFALRELTGADPGPTAEDWKRLFLRGVQVKPIFTGLQVANGVAADAHGRVFVSDGAVLQGAAGDRLKALTGEGAYRGLALDAKGNVLACVGGKVVAIDPDRGEVRVLADRHQGRPLNGPLQVALDRQGGAYFTDSPFVTPFGPADKGAVYYLSAQGTLTRLAVAADRPRGVAVAPDGKTLYLLGANAAEVTAHPLEGAGLPGAGKALCRLDGRLGAAARGSSLAVDAQGNLFVANVALHCVQVFNAQGAKLGQAPLPDAPLACAIGGEGGRTLYVATPTFVCAVRMEVSGTASNAR